MLLDLGVPRRRWGVAAFRVEDGSRTWGQGHWGGLSSEEQQSPPQKPGGGQTGPGPGLVRWDSSLSGMVGPRALSMTGESGGQEGHAPKRGPVTSLPGGFLAQLWGGPDASHPKATSFKAPGSSEEGTRAGGGREERVGEGQGCPEEAATLGGSSPSRAWTVTLPRPRCVWSGICSLAVPGGLPVWGGQSSPQG